MVEYVDDVARDGEVCRNFVAIGSERVSERDIYVVAADGELYNLPCCCCS